LCIAWVRDTFDRLTFSRMFSASPTVDPPLEEGAMP
jgi:hypothetical protein